MGLRDTFQKKPIVGVGFAVGLIVVAGAVAYVNRGSGGQSGGKAFYSDDDGVSWFVDDADKVPPFDHDGKQAVRAFVVQVDGRKSVAYLQRASAAAHQYQLDFQSAMKANQPLPKPPVINGRPLTGGDEIKRPGDKSWVPIDSYKDAGKIMSMTTPDGKPEEAVEP